MSINQVDRLFAMKMNPIEEKQKFLSSLKDFANNLKDHISQNDEWTIKGFIDIFKNVYSISQDTKVLSKLLELHIFPLFNGFAQANGYNLMLPEAQNCYPDLSFVNQIDNNIKFAVDIKTTYRKNEKKCHILTLGSHGEYFRNRQSSKNVQFPYGSYTGHFCLGIIYKRAETTNELIKYKIKGLKSIPSVIKDFIFFAEEKWKIAGDKHGSGNTANIGSVTNIDDILNGNGIFVKRGKKLYGNDLIKCEKLFDDYWINFGAIKDEEGKKITTLEKFLKYKNLTE